MNWATALGVGFCFGWLLQKAGLSRYDRIVNVYRFRDFAVFKFLLSALLVGALGIRVVVALHLAQPLPVPATYWVGNLTGGLIFGVGMALSGFCPGTIAAGIGEGRLDYLVPGSLGLIAGSLLFGALYPRFFGALARAAQIGLTIPDLLGVDPWLVVVLLAEVALISFYVVERGVPSASASAT